MKTLITIIAITFTAFTSRASESIPYIAMPTGIGYAIDANGGRHPNAFCLRDAVYAPRPQYPYESTGMADPETWTRNLEGNGLYRLEINLVTGRVNHITVIKWPGAAKINAAVIDSFKQWAFKPGKWKEITIATTVRKKWMAMTTQ
jgi:hypothetical protein